MSLLLLPDYGGRMPPLLFIHGAATTSAVWDPVVLELDDLASTHEFRAPDRPRTGSLAAELDFLSDHAEGAWIVGGSGGATLGLALAASGIALAGAILHEPAVGSTVPELLLPMREAFNAGGTAEFGATLYGPSWHPADAGGHGDDVTGRELAMFSGFEARPPADPSGTWITTVGEHSPDVRQRVADVLTVSLSYRRVVVPGASHFVQREHPRAFAAIIRSIVTASDTRI